MKDLQPRRWLTTGQAIEYVMRKFDCDEETAEAVLKEIRERYPEAARFMPFGGINLAAARKGKG